MIAIVIMLCQLYIVLVWSSGIYHNGSPNFDRQLSQLERNNFQGIYIMYFIRVEYGAII
jgi:hypothetical protein